jgi:amino acid transporter
MKVFTYIIIALAIVFIGINAIKLDFKNPLEGESLIAIIGIIAVLCAVVVLLIFRLSKSIEQKLKNQ